MKIALDEKKAATEAARNEAQRKQGSELASAEGALKSNEAREKKLVEMTQARLGAEEAVTLGMAILKDFEKPAVALLEAFASARKLDDAAKRWRAPSKGAADDVRGPAKCCKKTKGPFLLKIACNMRSSPVTAKAPGRPPISMPRVQALLPPVTRFQSSECLGSFAAAEGWCSATHLSIKSIENLGSARLDDNVADVVAASVAPRLMARKLLARLPTCLTPCIPSEKAQLLPGRHWVWPSFCSKLTRLLHVDATLRPRRKRP